MLDPRVAFLMDQLLEEVVRSGTGAGVYGRGINFPVAGKTGTSHDGWFAGFTSKLHLRGVGGLRRQSRAESGRRAIGAAGVDRIHEAGRTNIASTAT